MSAVFHKVYQPALAALAAVVVLVVGIGSYRSLAELADASGWVQHSMTVRYLTKQLSAQLSDSESGQRGFLVTSEQRFLARFYQAETVTTDTLSELKSLVADNPAQQARLTEIADLSADRFRQMADVIASHLRDGPESAKAIMMQSNGRVVREQLFSLISALDSVEAKLLEGRTTSYRDGYLQTRGTLLAFVALTLILIGSVYLLMRRELCRRAAAADKQTAYVSALDESLKTIAQERNEIENVNDVSNFLQSCNSVDEIKSLAGPFLQALFPGRSGTLSMFAASRNQLVRLVAWGDDQPIGAFSPDDCWSLRRGDSHHCDGQGIVPQCAHLAEDAALGSSLCLPLVAHGETLGLLTIRERVSSPDDVAHATEVNQSMQKGSNRRIGELVVRQLGLTLANLRLRETLNEQSIRDPLTGAFNRRYMDIIAKKEIGQALRFKRPFAVVMVDIDHFKRFNDLHGHSAGDVALVGLCDFLQKNIRDGDWMFRLGGEEFVLLLRELYQDEAEAKARELCNGLANLTLQNGKETLPRLTVSMGLAMFPIHGNSLEMLIERADKALYASKQMGRNRLSLATIAA